MMPSMSFDVQRLRPLLSGCMEVARDAGREIMAIYERGFTVQLKDDRSPLTEADLAAQRVIAAGLARLAPDIPLLGEESQSADIADRRQWPTLWLIDPLDGTREFVKRNGEFTVNIALIHQHQPLLGVVFAPALRTLYAAARGVGATRIDAAGVSSELRVAAQAAEPPRVLGSRSHGGGSLTQVLARLGAHELLGVGSALKFGWLAEGRADFYPRLSPTSEWDTAAGQAVVEAAGGLVVDLQGRPLRYNERETLLNPSFLAWADHSRDWLQLLRADSP
jgi:3'(2'), 5'-bisphosphate nucleotidase